MKLWEKIYILTLVIFLVFMNGSLYVIFHMTYKKDVRAEQDKAKNAFYMIESGINRDIKLIEKSTSIAHSRLTAILETYEAYYEKQQIALELWEEKQCIFPSEDIIYQKNYFSKKKEKILIKKENDIKTIIVTKKIDGISGTYYLLYRQPLVTFTNTWNKLWIQYIAMSIFMSILLALLLFWLLRRLMKPIGELTKAVKEITKGDYKTTVL